MIAIGTTVVRALEHAARAGGTVRPGGGMATQRIDRSRRSARWIRSCPASTKPAQSLRVLRAFQPDAVLQLMESEASGRGYRTHEFGDSVMIERSGAIAVDPRSLEALSNAAGR